MTSFIRLNVLVCLFHLFSFHQYGEVIRSDRDVCNGKKCGLDRPICAVPFKRADSIPLSCLSPAEIFDNASTVNHVFRYSGEGEIYFSSKSINNLFILQEEDESWRMSHSWSKSLHLIIIPINEMTRGHLFLVANREENTFRLIRIDSSLIPTSSPSPSSLTSSVVSTTVNTSTVMSTTTSTTSRRSSISSPISTTVMSTPSTSSRRSSISSSIVGITTTMISPMNNSSKRLYYLFCLLLLLIGVPIFIYFYKKRHVTVNHTPFGDIEMDVIE